MRKVRMSRKYILVVIAFCLVSGFIAVFFRSEIFLAIHRPYVPRDEGVPVVSISPISALGNGMWIRCYRTHDGAIYFRKHFVSTDGGKTVVRQPDARVGELKAGVAISRPGVFYAASVPARMIHPGTYGITAWRSTDELKTIQEEESLVHVPEGPTRERKKDEWYGLYVHRTLLEMPDGSWLMTMYGNFAQDTLPPHGSDARKETTYQQRSFIVQSRDQGRTWHYLSSVAVPKEGDPVGEGFVEPTLARLDDGRLLCVMRSGHHFPLYATWSSDGGRTWTSPVYTGLDRACDPCLIKLRDGRLALGWGRRYPEGWSRVTPEGDQKLFKYPGEGYTNLAISSDGGKTWINQKVAQRTGSCYPTIFEVEPNVIFFQVDEWFWRVGVRPLSTT